MSLILLYPGQQSALVELQVCLRDAHDDMRQARDEEIEERKRHNAPVDDETRWGEVRDLAAALNLAIEAQDSTAVQAKAGDIVSRVAHNAIEPLGPYVPDPDADGIMVRHVVMSDSTRRDLLARLADGWRAVRDAHLRGDSQVSIRALDEAICIAQEDFVAAGICEIIDDDGTRHTDIPALLPALRRSGLLGLLFRAAQAYQAMPPKKSARFGSLAPSTSGVTTTARGATSNVAAF